MFRSVFFGIFLVVVFPLLVQAELIDNKLLERAEKKYGMSAKKRFVSIDKDLLRKLRRKEDIIKLNFVNTWVNFIKYKHDIDLYGVRDYWATLYQFVGKNGGDCEDYTITKYYILKALGVDPHRMKFVYVIYKTRRGKLVSHMVLAYFKRPRPKTKRDILILDNNNRLVLPASKRPDLVKIIKMINGDTGAKSKKWKQLELNMKRKLL